ncbi:MAG: SpoIVB peptidase S55 domain-containing protein [Minicystis sp.]
MRLVRRLPTLLHPLRALLDPLSGARLVPLSIAAGAVASVALGVGLAQALPDPPDTLPLSEVKPGMKGYGLTVMSGTTPEKFDIEVISTLHNFRPNQDLVLIKTPHPRLNITRTVAGMSGSPIYLNGKMIGAYAYGWLFGVEPIAGVTPIRSMLEDMARPVPRTLFPAGGSPLPAADAGSLAPGRRSAHAFVGAPESYDLGAHAKQLAVRSANSNAAPEGVGLARASTPILIGGAGATSMKIASDLLTPLGLDPLQAGGGGQKTPDPDAPTKYVDGGGIGVELVRGDVSAMGLGTVTRVAGDRLVAFGHPMLGGGIEALPTAIAKVHWILASQNRSFKIGEAARSLGALVNDRQSAIVVDSSVKAPTFPIHLQIQGVDGAPKTTWNVEVAHDQFMAPTFTAMALGSSLEETTAERRDMTWRAVSKLKVAKFGTITVLDFGSGNGNPVGADEFVRGRLAKAIGALLNNPWEPVTIEGVDTTVKVTFEREVLHLRGVKVLDTEIDAGQPVRIRLELQPFQGKPETRVIEVKVPAEMAGRDVEIELSPGYEVERPLPTADNVGELMANLQAITFDPESVVATFRLKESGAAWRGKIASRLPPGALDTLRPSSQSDAPEIFAAQVQTAIPLKRFMVGRDSVRVFVRPVLR